MVLHADGKSYKQPLEVVLPPNSHGSEEDLKTLVTLQLKLRDEVSQVATMTNRIEVYRKQLEDQRKKETRPQALAAMEAIDKKLQDVEFQMISHSDALSDEKYDSEAARLYLNLLWLNLSLGSGTGKYAGGADYAPTDTAVSLAHDLENQLKAVKVQYSRLIEVDVPAYNRSAPALGLPTLRAENSR